MCGFTGYYNISELNNEKSHERLFSYIHRRGPDQKGKCIFDNITFLFSRLSIIDLSDKGMQPMKSYSGRYIMTFNGEIYNYEEIKLLLTSKSDIQIDTHSDSRILLESLEYFGFEILKNVRGMFSIALYDTLESKLFLINDRFGEKPLYYSYDNNSFMFSSDIKSFNFKKNKISKESLVDLLSKNCITYPKSIWQEVSRIQPAELIHFFIDKKIKKIKLIKKEKYWSTKNVKIAKSKDLLDVSVDKLDNLLSDTIEKQLNNDVETGCFLSGGIDSSLITSIASKVYGKNLKTFSIGFNNPDYDESGYALKIANYLGTDHYSKIMSLQDASNIFKKLPTIYGEPYSDSSQVPTVLLCDFSSIKIKVALTGDGGDELFGGYERYSLVPKIWKYINLIPIPIRNNIIKIFEYNSDFSYKKGANFIGKIFKKYKNSINLDIKLRNLIISLNATTPEEFSNRLSQHFGQDYIKSMNIGNLKKDEFLDYNKNFKDYSIQQKIMEHDVNNYLPNDLLIKTDRAAMHFGLETRMPFLDYKIYEFSKSIPDKFKVGNKEQKIILKRLLERYLPRELFDRQKQGFVSPITDIIKHNIKFIESLFKDDSIDQFSPVNQNIVIKELDKFKRGNYSNQYNLWDLIIFHLWIKNNVNNIIK